MGGTVIPLSFDEEEDRHEADEAKLVLEAARHFADQQLERADRLRTQARQTFIYVAGIFTVGQTVALSSFKQDNVQDSEMPLLLGLCIAAAVSLLLCGIALLRADKLRTVKGISSADITREAKLAQEKNEFVSERLTALYIDAADEVDEAIGQRTEAVFVAYGLAVLTILLVVAEIVVALIDRSA